MLQFVIFIDYTLFYGLKIVRIHLDLMSCQGQHDWYFVRPGVLCLIIMYYVDVITLKDCDYQYLICDYLE